jgi:hypothetical protein
MLGRLDWDIPPVAHQVGWTVKRYAASPTGSAPARCRFSGTYGGQGKAAGSSDLPAALLSLQTSRRRGEQTLAPEAAKPSNEDTLSISASLDDWARRQ